MVSKIITTFVTQNHLQGQYARLTCRFFYVQNLLKIWRCHISGREERYFCPWVILQRDIGIAFFIAKKNAKSPKMEKKTSSPEKEQPVTWQMNESEASYFSEMLNQSITSITERSAV